MTAARLPRVGIWSADLAGPRLVGDRHAEFVRKLEELGYPMVWIPEAFAREVMTHAALVLGRSDDLIVGTGIANMWARDAVAMANAARTLGEAYPGRFVLGVGVSHAPTVTARSHNYESPIRTLERYLQDMEQARWEGPPLRVPVPRLVGALGPRALALAARLTDGVHPYLITPDYTGQVRQVVGDAALVAPEQAVVLTDSVADARAAGRRHLARYLDRTNYRNSFLRQGFHAEDLDAGGSDRLVDAIVAWGSPATIRARVAEHLDAGADHVALQVLPARPDDDPLRTLAALASHLELESAPPA